MYLLERFQGAVEQIKGILEPSAAAFAVECADDPCAVTKGKSGQQAILGGLGVAGLQADGVGTIVIAFLLDQIIGV